MCTANKDVRALTQKSSRRQLFLFYLSWKQARYILEIYMSKKQGQVSELSRNLMTKFQSCLDLSAYALCMS